jgi:endoglucanase
MFGSADKTKRANAMTMYKSMWTQISERFKNYSDYLIFEGANEEVGNRLNDAQKGGKIGTLSKDELYETANKINQTFVDTVRATGGNNELRFLLIPGYNTDIDETCNDKFVMPTDSAKNKLIVSVH